MSLAAQRARNLTRGHRCRRFGFCGFISARSTGLGQDVDTGAPSCFSKPTRRGAAVELSSMRRSWPSGMYSFTAFAPARIPTPHGVVGYRVPSVPRALMHPLHGQLRRLSHTVHEVELVPLSMRLLEPRTNVLLERASRTRSWSARARRAQLHQTSRAPGLEHGRRVLSARPAHDDVGVDEHLRRKTSLTAARSVTPSPFGPPSRRPLGAPARGALGLIRPRCRRHRAVFFLRRLKLLLEAAMSSTSSCPPRSAARPCGGVALYQVTVLKCPSTAAS